MKASADIPSLRVSIRAWNAWAPGLSSLDQWREWASSPSTPSSEATPPLAGVPGILKRRLSKGGRAAFEVALNCGTNAALQQVELVFSSRHGESETTERLLESIAQREKLSPNDFSLSVHNSIVGLFSIFVRNTLPSQALSSRTSSFAAGLLEAVMRIQSGAAGVLYVYSDEQIPSKFATDTSNVFPLHAVGLLLVPSMPEEESTSIFDIRYLPDPLGRDSVTSLPQQLEFLRVMLSSQFKEMELQFGPGKLAVKFTGCPFESLWRSASSTT